MILLSIALSCLWPDRFHRSNSFFMHQCIEADRKIKEKKKEKKISKKNALVKETYLSTSQD